MTAETLIGATAVELARAVRERKTSARDLLDATLARIESINPVINAFTSLTKDRARTEADRVDARIAAGEDPGPLAGVPYAVKNLYDVAGEVTLAGSVINRGNPPAQRDATAVQRLSGAGAVLVGLLNMDEYAYGFTTENSHYGATRNPHDLGRSAGGSSGGSAAAVAAGLVPLALGTDTNGSIRVPASICGIHGFKPTYGRLSRAGVFPFAASLDHTGPLARSTADLALAYDAMRGPDIRDPVCCKEPSDALSESLESGIDGLRIALAGGYFREILEPQALKVVDTAADALGVKREVEIPEAATARAAAFVITTVEGAAVHMANLRSRKHDFDPLIRDRLIAGAMAPAAWYTAAQRFRRWYCDRVLSLFSDCDVILAPATPCVPQPLWQEMMTLDGQELPVRPTMGRFTQPLTLIGLPIVTVPVPVKGQRLPIGLQVIAAPWRESDALRVARALEVAGVAAIKAPSMA
jgi:AtzE family amidohydrolase